MFKLITSKSITAIAATAFATILTGGLAVFLTTTTPEANATPALDPVLARPDVQTNAKGDRLLALVKGSACSSRAWPNYDQSCQFDLRQPADAQARVVRLIPMR